METADEKYQRFPLFNPLDKTRLGNNVAEHLLSQEAHELPPPAFYGAGIYALYYRGDFEHYRPFAQLDAPIPLYIGKAIPEGGRKGAATDSSEFTKVLFKRLKEHAKTIEQVHNLKSSDFYCRFLVVDDIWIPLAESILIERFTPIWNAWIEGFGIHDPGNGRKLQKKSVWDTLHPGRSFANGLPDNPKAIEIIEKLRALG